MRWIRGRDRRLEVGRLGIDYIQRPSWCCILTPPARLRPARIAAGDMRFREGTRGWLEWCGAKRSMSRASIGLLGAPWACQPISLCHVDPSVLGSFAAVNAVRWMGRIHRGGLVGLTWQPPSPTFCRRRPSLTPLAPCPPRRGPIGQRLQQCPRPGQRPIFFLLRNWPRHRASLHKPRHQRMHPSRQGGPVPAGWSRRSSAPLSVPNGVRPPGIGQPNTTPEPKWPCQLASRDSPMASAGVVQHDPSQPESVPFGKTTSRFASLPRRVQSWSRSPAGGTPSSSTFLVRTQ